MEKLGDVLRFLRARGFAPVKRKGSRHFFHGLLECRRVQIKVSLELKDLDFLSYPIFRILERPTFWPSVLPHVSADGCLCYFRSGEVILDRFNPVNALAQCLDQATRVANELGEESYRQREFELEFGPTWNMGQTDLPMAVMVGNLDDTPAAKWYATNNRILIASSRDEIEKICGSAGWPIQLSEVGHCGIVASVKRPLLPSKLPTTIGELFKWMRSWDPTAYKEIQKQLGLRLYLQFKKITFLVRTPDFDFGFDFDADHLIGIGFQKRPGLYRNYLHNRGRDTPIRRLSITRIGSNHVHSRNLTHDTLKDRSITLIGCGAIGGYLSQALTKLGAGTGTGKLSLIDPDRLSSDNLGRHLLGYESLLQEKADAVRQYLLKQFPASNIVALPRHVEVDGDIKGDLVINATGEEALSEALNARHVRLPTKPDLLHVWIAGNGQAVQALWVDKPKYACFRCLRVPDEKRTPRFALLPGNTETKVIGCSAFTPYAVSAPLQASSLAIDMLIAWLNGNPSPRFRTRVVEGSDARRLKNQDLAPLDGCIACR